MEPPAKKRRQGQSPFDAQGGHDDDELFFEPHEIRAKRDPGYKLSLERAYADNRFQATMAHIFEKYSRNFEGIGDEIDMVTGDIVVNNGHLQNMRNEVDVGLPGPEDGIDDEDEGILLEDLLDEDVIGKDTRDYYDKEQQEDEDEDEEDRIMHGQGLDQHSTALVPASHFRAVQPHNGFPSLLSGTFAGPPGGFDPSTSFGASPLAFGASPFAMDPWGLPSLFSGPAWEPSPIVPRQPKLLPSSGDRYDFPIQDGESSIWAPNYRYKDNEPDRTADSVHFGPPRPPGKTKTRPMKYLLPPTTTRTEEDDDVDEDAILTGKSTAGEKLSKPTETVPSYDDDPLNDTTVTTIAAKETTKRARKRALVKNSKDSEQSNTRTSDKGNGDKRDVEKSSNARRQASSSNTAQSAPRVEPSLEPIFEVIPESGSTPGVVTKGLTQSSQNLRKDAKCLGTEGATETTGSRHPRGNIMVQIPFVDGRNRDEFEEINDLVDEVADSQDECPSSSEQQNTETKLIAPPASSDGLTPQSHSAPRKQVASSRTQTSRKALTRREPNSVFTLSDDELPVFVRPKPSLALSGSKQPATRASSSEPLDSGIGDSATTISSTELDEQDNATAASSPTVEDAISRQPTALEADTASVKKTQTHSEAHRKSKAAPRSSVDKATPQTTGKESRRTHKLKEPDASVGPPRASSTQSRPKRSSGARTHDETETTGDSSATEPQPCLNEPISRKEVTELSSVGDKPQATLLEPVASPPPKTTHKDTPKASLTKPTPAKATPRKQHDTPSKPQTPRHTTIPTARAPSSRRSILSLLSDDDDAAEADRDFDELGRAVGSSGLPAPFLSSGAPSSRKIWKSSARTTEVYHTPIKRRPTDVVSPSSIIKTPGGTTRTCGLDGYRCGRDFCFTCL
ncbi:centromere protein scm3 domain-containing protein [Purpureocillium lavendulum]|uniref:Centromere protein scm3 domain-containing protein n=1 Tax=Purpureocillium lavendulum TaxID=1247861 RepID=A0AB34FTS5_9HYPO|nr:centromere protein scm3 domain-containing protein [Purpureocillium lavendulum]